MSLDVYLTLPGEPAPSETTERIFVRQDGATVEVSREEWDALNPGREPVTLLAPTDEREVYTANITHNLGRMANEAGLYEAVWRPDEHGYEQAEQLIQPLRIGLAQLQSRRSHFEQFNPGNGWGDYGLLLSFTAGYLIACETWPDAEVRVWR